MKAMGTIVISGIDQYGHEVQETIHIEQQGIFYSRNHYKTLGPHPGPGLALVVVRSSWLRKLSLWLFPRKWKIVERITENNE